MMDSFGTEWAEEVKPHRPTEPCDQPPSLGSPQADSNPTVQPGSTPLPGRVKLDELSSAGSSLGPRPGSVQRPETDLDESEDDVPLARHYLRTQQLPAFPAQKHDGSASPSGSRKRGRPSQERTGPDWAGAADFLQVDQPRYTIIKASGTKDDPHVIRLKARVTDGILSRLPAVGSAHTNQGILHAAPDGLFQAWCLSIGGRVARLLGLPRSGKYEDSFRLESLPERYALYQNVKTIPPTRKDPYLWGPPRTGTLRYRSAPELAPHVYWLLIHNRTDPKECACRYCTGRQSQIEINRELGLQDSQVYHSAVRHAVYRTKPNTPRKPKRAKSPRVTYLGPFTSPLRDSDLAQGAATFRQSELVWVKLNQALVHPSGDPSFTITHWPSLICDRQVKLRKADLAGDLPEAGHAPTFEPVSQCNVYKVQLLALEDAFFAEERTVLAWAGMSAAALSIEDFGVKASSSLVFNGQAVLTPRLSHFLGDGQLAMSAYALAIQTANNLEVKFATTDMYESPNAQSILSADKAYERGALEYQSVWWGAEQIHSEELVRVCVPPEKIETDRLLPLSDSVRHQGLLLKLSAIFRSPVPSGGEPVIKLAGTLVGLEKVKDKISAVREEGKEGEQNQDDLTDLNLPRAPVGYAFRRLTPKDHRVDLDLEYLGARFYPLPDRLDGQPGRIARTLDEFDYVRAQEDLAEKVGEEGEVVFNEDQLALILAGLLPAKLKFGPAAQWAENRFKMIVQAEVESRGDMERYFRFIAGEVKEEDGADIKIT